MPLKKYHAKRDFNKTTEPYGKAVISKKRRLTFVVQKHAASHLHYDFRLELNGVLISWAIPKGPSLDPKIKRLAVNVEDHPLEYGSFEGNIPKGEYGGGVVMLWDNGTWEEESQQGYKNGNLTFTLTGKKLKGKWKLIQIKKDPKNWLLIKVNDDYAQSEKDYDITTEETLSVVTGKSLAEIKESTEIWSKNTKISQSKQTNKKKIIHTQAKKSVQPEIVSPQLATLVNAPPTTDQWLHELKYDGYRLLCHINQNIRLLTRGQQDWTHKFDALVQDLSDLHLPPTILDGEIVALDDNKMSHFQQLQNQLHSKNTQHLIYYVFDIVYYNGYDLSDVPLIQRKNILESLIPKTTGSIRYSDHIIGEGDTVFEKACQLSYEGIISKEINSTYTQKRTKSWLKIKCVNRQEFIVCGYTKPKGNRSYFGSLLLGYYNAQKKLCYAGHVGTGFSENSLKEIATALDKYKTPISPFQVSVPEPNLASWLKPKMVVEIEFREWTEDGILRHPSFKGVRMDKPAAKISQEKKTDLHETTTVSQINITHPDKILYPEKNITKLDLVHYFEKVSHFILPHIINRPLSILRCPHGWGASCFYQKHLNENDKSSALFTVDIKEKNGTEKYLYIKNISGLIKLVQMGVLEIHPWGCQIDKIEKPDRIIFDLDPGLDVEWKKVIDCAFALKEELKALGLQSFVKTTGGKGLHLVIPILRKYTWEDVTHFSKIFANYLAKKYPTQYIDNMSKAKRQGKIFIDYLRNNRGSTAVAPYSTRARENAPIATPIAWDELSAKIKSDQFTIPTLLKRLDTHPDPWKSLTKLKQALPKIE